MKHPSFFATEGRLPEPGQDYEPEKEMCEDDYDYLGGYGQYSDNVKYFVEADLRSSKVHIIGTKEGDSVAVVKARYADLAPLFAMGPQAIKVIRAILEYRGSIVEFFGPDHPLFNIVNEAQTVIEILDYTEEK